MQFGISFISHQNGRRYTIIVTIIVHVTNTVSKDLCLICVHMYFHHITFNETANLTISVCIIYWHKVYNLYFYLKYFFNNFEIGLGNRYIPLKVQEKRVIFLHQIIQVTYDKEEDIRTSTVCIFTKKTKYTKKRYLVAASRGNCILYESVQTICLCTFDEYIMIAEQNSI